MYILCFLFFFYFFFCSSVENTGYICDFTSEKYNLGININKSEDVICYHKLSRGDTIGIIIPKYEKGYEDFHIITKCFDEISLEPSGDSRKSIYSIFKKNQIELSETQITFNNDNNTSILKINEVEKPTLFYCIFENRDDNKLLTHRGIVEISVDKNPTYNSPSSTDIILDLFNKLTPNVNVGQNSFYIMGYPGYTLYILAQLLNKPLYFFNDNCPLNFEKIGDIYKYTFPKGNAQNFKFFCPMYYEDNNVQIYIALIIIEFRDVGQSLDDIKKGIINKQMKDDIEKNLNKMLNGVEHDYIGNDQLQGLSIEMNDEKNIDLQLDYPCRDSCNNDKCKDFFDNSSCSSKCGHGYRLMNGYDLNNIAHIVVPCNNGECKIEDEIEPLIIFTYTSMIFFCIIITIFTIMIYFLITNRNKKVADPFVTYDSNLNTL
ncbi:sporozoite surface protein 3, putative [Plasmodium gallinaceum]|uniref:Sporozoite surface protein 3, putative n=1 Tax=Plasmodium gallinaceum TaxID=5849 RepID=A0A1J1GYX1_PLAGA|nr:sporozoite surface protein 3, putative [Plasmodium gallinaceum]CRG97661.1 sporozoite surface protein 3, putative [Plasmodium gallinaceum]